MYRRFGNGSFFNRSRLLLAAFSVGLFYWFVQGNLQVSLDDPMALDAYLATSLAVPVLGLYLLLLPEKGI